MGDLREVLPSPERFRRIEARPLPPEAATATKAHHVMLRTHQKLLVGATDSKNSKSAVHSSCAIDSGVPGFSLGGGGTVLWLIIIIDNQIDWSTRRAITILP